MGIIWYFVMVIWADAKFILILSYSDSVKRPVISLL